MKTKLFLLIGLLFLLAWPVFVLAAPDATIYYVSSSGGSDSNNGLSESKPFKTIAKVNGLNLLPGDRVLFKCGDTWRGEMLTVKKSGTAGQPITFTSYPAGCADKPIISGAQPIAGWAVHSGSIYVADLSAGANAGKFGYGVNQLFRGETRLTFGRWPNLNAPDGGYSTIDGAGGSSITDNELPAGSWGGAVIHMKSIRWAILNRKVTSSSGQTLSLGNGINCWGGCVGWGYFVNNHLATLDQDGEWYYDSAAKRLYLYSASGTPTGIEGSVMLTNDDRSWGGITLGVDLDDPIAYVTIENLAVVRWYRNGIATPTNLHPTENHDLAIHNNTITDVDGTGINLSTWVWGASDGRPDGWRGGYNQTISGNWIERANHIGIDLYARNSTFSNNTLRDIARIQNLGAAGMGCGYDQGDASGGVCTEDGDGIRVKIGQANDTGNNNTFTGNRLERIGFNGFDVFGFGNIFEHNVIIEACISKGDCGAVRTFGRDSLAASAVHDLIFAENILVNTTGNTDGCDSEFDALFGFGFYLDNYSRDITLSGNTVISSTVHGILFQNSTGTVTGNTLYNNGRTYPYAAGQVYVGASPAYVSSQTGNILFSLTDGARTLSLEALSRLGTSNNNSFFSPYRAKHIRVSGDKTLAEWKTYSGKDSNSSEHWYTQPAGEAPKSRIFYNDTAQTQTIDLGNVLYKGLDQTPVSGSITLAAYTSRILIATGEAADLVVSMALLSSADAVPGAPITYTITLANQGVLAASNVTLANPIPAQIINTAWQSTPGTATLQSGTRYTWQITNLPVGAAYTFTVSGQYDPAITPGMPLTLTATASTSSPEANPINNTAILRLGNWKLIYLPLIRR
jgi:uncharacterized repeat protein (TIGR01451 family)